jgi:Ca2+/Na+ antiporter
MAGGSSWNPIVAPEDATNGQLASSIAAYLYLLFQASNYISDGSEHLLLVPEIAPLIGSIVLPVLGAVPDGMMVLFSGLGENAQEEVSVGVGALAGSTIMLLTLPWAISVLSGRVNLDGDGVPRYKRPADAPEDWEKLSPPGNMSLLHTGVGFGGEIQDAARYMVFTMLGYFVIQGPAFLVDSRKAGDTASQLRGAQAYESDAERYWALAGLVVCVVGFLAYLHKMWRESKKEESAVADRIVEVQVDAMQQGTVSLRGALAKYKDSRWLEISDEEELSRALIDRDTMEEVRGMCKMLAPFYKDYDANGDNTIDFEEFRMILNDVNENIPKEMQRTIFDNADTDGNGSISFHEFVACLMSFLSQEDTSSHHQFEEKRKRRASAADPWKLYASSSEQDESSPPGDGEDDEPEEEEMPEDLADLEPQEQQRRIKLRAAWKMALGSAIVLIFSDPAVDVMAETGRRLNISPFYVSFVMAPIASNATELVAAYNYACKRTTKSMTTSLGTLLGAGVMNNTFCLGIFLGLVYFKSLAWEFSAETLSILVVEAVVALLVWGRRTMNLLSGLLVLAMYPLSLYIVYALTQAGLD